MTIAHNHNILFSHRCRKRRKFQQHSHISFSFLTLPAAAPTAFNGWCRTSLTTFWRSRASSFPGFWGSAWCIWRRFISRLSFYIVCYFAVSIMLALQSISHILTLTQLLAGQVLYIGLLTEIFLSASIILIVLRRSHDAV